MSKTKEKSAAIITVFAAEKMTPAARRRIAGWMREQAKFLEKHRKEFSPRFRARYLYA